jgi:hypothetical protein
LNNDHKHTPTEFFKLANSPLVVANFKWSLLIPLLYKSNNTMERGGGGMGVGENGNLGTFTTYA